MYISSQFKSQLLFNWHLNLIDDCTTQSISIFDKILKFTLYRENLKLKTEEIGWQETSRLLWKESLKSDGQ